jgi:CRP/FNR family transcriptional regulator, anaerobic regulatory protein
MTRKTRQPTTEEIRISCSNCSLAELCLPHGLTEAELEQLEKIVKRKPPLQPGQHLYRAGDPSLSLYAVRSGTLKSYYTTDDGDEQVLGFTLPGEMVGFDGLSDGHYTSNSVVLETSCVCSLPYERLEEMCHTTPGLHKQIMRVVGREITLDHQMLLLLGKRSAEERLATFLVSLSKRYRARGLSATEFNLPMSRQDIGNYLGLAIETVSRLFAHFQEQGLLTVNRRRVVLHDLDRLTGRIEGYLNSVSVRPA